MPDAASRPTASAQASKQADADATDTAAQPASRVYYAIGDIHGEADRLARLHDTIFEHHDLCHPGTCATLVHLGDYVDRGPDSRGVIERLRVLEQVAEQEPTLDIVCLRGNHEQMMIDALDGGAMAEAHWARNGGVATMDSYENDPRPDLLHRHHAWLKTRPYRYWSQEDRLIFVHAGLSSAAFPDENPDIYLWTRSPKFFNTDQWTAPALEGHRVIHGHTPTQDYQPFVSEDGRRINIDTGACLGGVLTAAVIVPDGDVRFLTV